MAISFLGQIKNITIAMSASQDKTATIKVEIFNVAGVDEVIAKLNEYHKPDSPIYVTVMSEQEVKPTEKDVKTK